MFLQKCNICLILIPCPLSIASTNFNTATFDSPIATQTADSGSILDLTFDVAGLHNDASLLSYLNTNSYVTQSYVNTNTLTPTQVTDEISTRLAGYTVKSLAAGANIGLTGPEPLLVTVNAPAEVTAMLIPVPATKEVTRSPLKVRAILPVT